MDLKNTPALLANAINTLGILTSPDEVRRMRGAVSDDQLRHRIREAIDQWKLVLPQVSKGPPGSNLAIADAQATVLSQEIDSIDWDDSEAVQTFCQHCRDMLASLGFPLPATV